MSFSLIIFKKNDWNNLNFQDDNKERKRDFSTIYPTRRYTFLRRVKIRNHAILCLIKSNKK